MRLHIPHVHEVSVVIIQPNIATLVGVGPWSDVVRVTGDSFPCGRYWFFPLSGNKEGNKNHMMLRVRTIPNRFPISVRFTKMDGTTHRGRLRWSSCQIVKSLLLSCSRPTLLLLRLSRQINHNFTKVVKGLQLIKLDTPNFTYSSI